MKPKICIYATAHRPQNWMSLYNSIGENDVEFELVFVGPNNPDCELPKNFRFIKTDVKPSQCLEIAIRNATADLIMDVADDYEFATPRPLDKLYDLYRSCNSDKVIVSSRFMQNGKALPISVHNFFSGYGSTLVFPLCGLLSRKLHQDLGGIDRNFEAIFGDLDMTMRIYALGGKVVISDVYIDEDKSKCDYPERDLWGETAVNDRAFIENLWTTDGKVHFNRKRPVEPFLDKDILRVSQGPRGRWRGKGLPILEKIENNLRSHWSISGKVVRAIKRPSMYPGYIKKAALYLKNAVLRPKG